MIPLAAGSDRSLLAVRLGHLVIASYFFVVIPPSKPLRPSANIRDTILACDLVRRNIDGARLLSETVITHAQRVGRFLEQDAENSYLAGDAVDKDSMAQLLGHSITYQIAVGPQAGRKVFILQTLPVCDPEDQSCQCVFTTFFASNLSV